MDDEKGQCIIEALSPRSNLFPFILFVATGKGGKNRRRGKGDGEESKRELEFKEEGKRRQ